MKEAFTVSFFYIKTHACTAFGTKIWESLSNNLKNKEPVDSFKTATKKWKPESSPCRLCKTYLQNIGYLY